MSDKYKNISGKKYWKSLNQLEGKKEFDEFLHREFPQGASEMNNAWSRRNFISLMGASMALAGLAGCRRPKEHIVPYVQPPEEVIPGIANFYATTMPLGAHAYGVVVESHEGRPTKIEGNKLHPSSKGKVNSLVSASILGLYDPDRSQKISEKGIEKSWEDFMTAYGAELEKHKANDGEGLAILTGSYSSPTIARLRKQFEKEFKKGTWVSYDPVSDENIYNGLALATGKKLQPVYDYSQANVILSLDSDFVQTESENINATLGFSAGRTLEDEHSKMNRLYVVESTFSSTGAVADHRLVLKQSELGKFALAVLAAINDKNGDDSLRLSEKAQKWVVPVAEDLKANKGKSLVVAGYKQPAEMHALVYLINKELENLGRTYSTVEPLDKSFSSTADLVALTEKLNNGTITGVFVLGSDPVYSAPADLKFRQALRKAAFSVHVGLYQDRTALNCHWHIPSRHYLESWSDARAVDGTASVVQPLIDPLFDGKSEIEVINYLTTGADKPGYELVRETWDKLIKGNFEKGWRRVLHDGVLENSFAKMDSANPKENDIIKSAGKLMGATDAELQLVITASPSIYDGRFVNNGWLQELPDAVTKISWDNVAQMSPATAKKYGFKNEDLITIKANGAEIRTVAWIVPAIAEGVVVLELGFGQHELGRVAKDAGFDVYPLRTTSANYLINGAELAPAGETYELANVQDHWSMEGRAIVREASKEEYEHEPDFAPHAVHHPPLASMWEEVKYDKGNQWGMAIDLTACTGCNACTIACQSENNIPIIGKQEVRNGREMHWIRIDRYFNGEVEDPESVEMVHQPVGCQHCELAPCEQVCPVAATVHDKEGLNTMVYNRCIGTRYCANNCPYKVRRFNFFNFTKETPEIVKMAMNPDVTVRSRGVMEKCTYCIQRINKVKIEAKKADRSIKDGEIVTACQQACPANAIVFGDINNPESEVVKTKERNRNYELLGEINVRPRTSYLAKIRNKNPKLV